jgi:enamine deaminase RidA (YjgF/YER057c/UK114 family)
VGAGDFLEVLGVRREDPGADDVDRFGPGLAQRADDFEEIALAHGAIFGDVRPACTYVITRLIDPRWRVEIEAEALVP